MGYVRIQDVVFCIEDHRLIDWPILTKGHRIFLVIQMTTTTAGVGDGEQHLVGAPRLKNSNVVANSSDEGTRLVITIQ